MKSLIGILLAATTVIWGAHDTKAQVTYDLQIDSVVGLPDSILNGQTVEFFVQISLNTPLIYQGPIFLELEYGGNFYPVDTVSSQNFLNPNNPTTVQAQHRFSTDDDLNIGDNVVVVWPRIGDGQEPPQTVSWPYSTVITLVEPNSITEPTPSRVFQSFLAPNPASDMVQINLDNRIDAVSINVYNILGAAMTQRSAQRSLDVSRLPAGVYYVDVISKDGQVFTDKLLITR